MSHLVDVRKGGTNFNGFFEGVYTGCFRSIRASGNVGEDECFVVDDRFIDGVLHFNDSKFRDYGVRVIDSV